MRVRILAPSARRNCPLLRGGIWCRKLLVNYMYIQLSGKVQVRLCVRLQMRRRSVLEVYERLEQGSALHVPEDAVDLFCRPWKAFKKVFGTGLTIC